MADYGMPLSFPSRVSFGSGLVQFRGRWIDQRLATTFKHVNGVCQDAYRVVASLDIVFGNRGQRLFQAGQGGAGGLAETVEDIGGLNGERRRVGLLSPSLQYRYRDVKLAESGQCFGSGNLDGA